MEMLRYLSLVLIFTLLVHVYYSKFILPKLFAIRMRREENREVNFMLGTGDQKSDLEKQLWQHCNLAALFLTPCFIAMLAMGTVYVLVKQGWNPIFLTWKFFNMPM